MVINVPYGFQSLASWIILVFHLHKPKWMYHPCESASIGLLTDSTKIHRGSMRAEYEDEVKACQMVRYIVDQHFEDNLRCSQEWRWRFDLHLTIPFHHRLILQLPLGLVGQRCKHPKIHLKNILSRNHHLRWQWSLFQGKSDVPPDCSMKDMMGIVYWRD